MKPKRIAAAIVAIAISTAADAATIDMNDPLRAKAREDDVRIDAQLLSDTVSPGSPIGVNWQIQNFTSGPVAVDTKHVSASYDADSHTITLAIGSEVPADGNMPAMLVVAPGETKVFRAAANAAIPPSTARGGLNNAPLFVQVKVSILRDIQAFLPLIESHSARPQRLSDELFEQWFESTDTIFLNTLPVMWSARPKGIDAEQRTSMR
ncbi:MAG TPA: hypothetical protein VEU30_17380 [Thermoanaerobaculia bacterium]|nr:hypothetical protein [Thermoanaerobaculia bacterium]